MEKRRLGIVLNQLSPDQVAAIAARVIAEERMNFGKSSDADGGRAQRNKDWARIAGIIHHGHPVYNPTPDPRWHIKDAGGGRPQSDDVLAFKDTRMIIDFIGNAGADGFTVRAGHWEGPIGPEQNIYAPPVPEGAGVPGSTPVTPPPSEYWTGAHQDVWNRLLTKTPLVVAEQLAHSFPAEGWGRKTAGPNRPISDNTIARRLPNGRLFGVKVQPMVVLWGELPIEQQFVPVQAVNHLGGSTVVTPPVDPNPPVTPPQSPAPTIDLKPVLDKLEAVVVLATEARDSAQGALDAVNKPRRFAAQGNRLVGSLRGTIEAPE